MATVFKILKLILVALLGGLAYAATFNVLVAAGILSADIVDENFSADMTQKAVFIWLGCVAIAIASLFVEKRWGLALFLSPLYAPSIFSVIFVLLQR